MKNISMLLVLTLSTLCFGKDGETGVLGVRDPFEVGAVVGTYAAKGAVNAMLPMQLSELSATLMGVRIRGGGYTHQTILGNAGGIEGTLTLGYALSNTQGKDNFFWGQLDMMAVVGIINKALGPVVVRLNALVGFGFSLWNGASLLGGGRLALGIVPNILTIEGSYLAIPTVNITLGHRIQADIKIEPIGVALGAELNMGSAAAGLEHFSIMGTLVYRPSFD